MPLRIRFQYPSGSTLGYSIERLADGLLYDFASSVFQTNPANPVADLPEDTGIFVGRYRANVASTPPTQFTDGDYLITIHDKATGNLVVAQLPSVMRAGDDSSVSSSPSGGDPWNVLLPGTYPTGTAGAILGTYLDAKVSTRSTFSGGSVTSVLNPVTVATNLDKTGYILASIGLDPISVEPGINVRQALSPLLAAAAGQLSGAGTGSIVLRAAGGSITRITATTDNAGNRSSIDLNLPA